MMKNIFTHIRRGGITWGIAIIMSANCLSAYTQTAPENETIQIPVETIVDKIRGGMLGQFLGNLNGLPHEFKYIHEPGQVKNYVPSLLDGAWTDDDTDFEWVYVLEMQKTRNALLPYDEIFNLWKSRINRRIWCANLYARHLMDLGILPPFTGHVLLNPWSEFNVSGQFLSETFGLIAPAMPQTAAKIGLHYTQVAIDDEPAQTTQLFTAMIASAFLTDDIDAVIDAGIANIDANSNTLNIISDVKMWHTQYPTDWERTRWLLRDKYTLENGGIRDVNGTELNTGAIIAALLYGAGDFAETLKLAFNFGWDADCNAATVGTIVGVMDGYRNMLSNGWYIMDRYKNTTRDNMPMDETITSFADRLIELFEMVNQNNGGSKCVSGNTMVYKIVKEAPAPIVNIQSPDKQRAGLLLHTSADQLQNDVRYGDDTTKARAAYMAVCLDLDGGIRDKHPKQWEAAMFQLSGYWKVMNNIFYGNDFKGLQILRNKFTSAGLRIPKRKYTNNEVYNDSTLWKHPDE